MGISVLNAAMILAEHRYRPIEGVVLTIGRQTVGLNGARMDQLLRLMGVPKRAGTTYDVDVHTVGVDKSLGHISQESFFAAFTDADVRSLDVSAYEQADIVHDIQDDLPPQYYGYADFIYNGSCLDNIFDPAASIKNIGRMLKPGGRVYHFEQGNSHPTAYLKYSADWFMDFYAINNYTDCKVYICDTPNSLGQPLRGPKRAARISPFDLVVYAFNPYVEHEHGVGYDCSSIEAFTRYEVHCIAEKSVHSTDHRNPIQKHYRVDSEHKETCLASVKRFLHSARPLFRNGAPFDLAEVPRIDSSDYPQQIVPVAVFGPNYFSGPGHLPIGGAAPRTARAAAPQMQAAT